MSILSVDGLCVNIGESRILRDVALEVRAREVVCLMGRNGVGKTTTLKAIMGLLPAQGRATLGGHPMQGWGPHVRSRRGIGYVPQGRDIFPGLTVLENLKLALVARGQRINGELDRILDLFPVLKPMLARKGGVLSGGQQQQLAIARALLTQPRVLMLDEPTEGIQPSIVDAIGNTLAALKAEGKVSILLVEQCVEFARAVADRFYVMQKGQIVAQGDMTALSDQVVRQHLSV
ncbi:MAG: urea ABC transporter ATP-binding subunit UrtE [Verrucomicrobia bacterium]|nr:urea ABC transporter ATP-binding subunit UrtE [Verrucomicrobiota bacterium]